MFNSCYDLAFDGEDLFKSNQYHVVIYLNANFDAIRELFSQD